MGHGQTYNIYIDTSNSSECHMYNNVNFFFDHYYKIWIASYPM